MTIEELWTFILFYEPLGIIIFALIMTIIFELWMRNNE